MSTAVCLVRPAAEADVPQVVEAVEELLAELRAGSAGPLPPSSAEVCRALVRQGLVLVASDPRAPGEIVGLVAATVQETIHLGGPYGLIQELWVAPSHRSGGLGAELVDELRRRLAARGIDTVEVGLPRRSFGSFERTHRFYEQCGFDDEGPRQWTA